MYDIYHWSVRPAADDDLLKRGISQLLPHGKKKQKKNIYWVLIKENQIQKQRIGMIIPNIDLIWRDN